MTHTLRYALTLASCIAVAASTARAAGFSQLVSFGDSLSDVGNVCALTNDTLPGGPGYVGGNFTNGPVWVERLADSLGAPAPTPSLLGGSNWAHGSTTTGTGNTTFILPNLRTQIAGWTSANTPTSGQLFTVLAGANDLFGIISSGQPASAQIAAATQAANNVAIGVRALVDDGASHIVVANLPDLGLIPRFRNTGQQAQATLLTDTFCAALAANLATIDAPSTAIHLLDLQSLFDAAIASPSTYGLTNASARAYTGDEDFGGDGTIVANPGGYLFWDSVHPTATGHALIADAALALLPEPASVMLLLSLPATLVRRRR